MTPMVKRASPTLNSAALKPGRVTSQEFFYEGGGRHKSISQILHCVRFSPGLIVLTGPTGSGRSLILQALLKNFNPDEADICTLGEDCPVLESEADLYQALAQGFGLESRANETIEDLAERIHRLFAASLQQKRLVLIAVDDARQHAHDVLDALLHLVAANKGLNVLLVGDSNLQTTLKEFNLQSLTVHNVSLRPLLVEEIADYVRQYRLARDPSAQIVLTKKELDTLMANTGGNMALLQKELQQQKSPRDQQPVRSLGRLARYVAMVLFLMVMAAGIGWWVLHDAASTPSPTVAHGDTESVLVNPPSVPGQPKAPSATAPEPAVAGEPEKAAAMPPSSTVPQAVVPSAESKLPDEQVKTPPTQATPPSQDVDVERFTADEEWLLALPPNHWVLQVANLPEESKVQAMIASAGIGRVAIHYYRRIKGTQVAYIVIYGDYPARQDAQSDIASLPAILRQAAPWARLVKDIQQELTTRP